MKICYVSSILNVHDFRFLKKFREKGYETHVVSFDKRNVKLDQNMAFYYCELRTLKQIPKAVFFLKKILKNIKPDILHGGFIQMDGFICSLSGYRPFILMPWGSDVLLYPRKSHLMGMITRYAIRKASIVTCDAEYVKSEIARIGPYPASRIIVIPWGVDLEKFRPGVERLAMRKRLDWEDKKVIVMTRNFEPKYGVEYFLHAIPKIVKEVPDARFLLCGGGSLKDQFVRFINDHALHEYVVFAGYVRNHDIPKYLGAADVYVSTSLSDGVSVSLLEAMACGLPVVVTDNPSILEWVKDGENGFVIPKYDSVVLIEKLICLLKDELLMEQFGERNAKTAKEKANWNKNFEKFEHLYKLALGG